MVGCRMAQSDPVPQNKSTSAVARMTVAQLREAAKAWRAHTRSGSSWEQSAADRIDELIDEVERLRDLLVLT
jgi:hypothetical protein